MWVFLGKRWFDEQFDHKSYVLSQLTIVRYLFDVYELRRTHAPFPGCVFWLPMLLGCRNIRCSQQRWWTTKLLRTSNKGKVLSRLCLQCKMMCVQCAHNNREQIKAKGKRKASKKLKRIITKVFRKEIRKLIDNGEHEWSAPSVDGVTQWFILFTYRSRISFSIER